MTPLRARLALLAVSAIFLATAANVLFLQDQARLRGGSQGPVSVTQFPMRKAVVTLPGPAQGAQKPPSGDSAPKPADNSPRLLAALKRELSRKGYPAVQPPNPNLPAAILAYEFDSGQQLTGQPSEALLKTLIFDLTRAPRGNFADRAETDSKLMLETQKTLLGLGFFSGSLSGQMDVWTANAVTAFERHRGLPPTGRLSETVLLELINYSGQPLRRGS